MRRVLFLLTFVISLPLMGLAQDVIILHNTEEIQAIVKEIGLNTVTYKKYSNPNGPNYTIEQADIFMIKYANGEKEVFKNAVSSYDLQREREEQARIEEQNAAEQARKAAKEAAFELYKEKNGRHNIKITSSIGLGYTTFDDLDIMFGGGFNFAAMYNFTFPDYSGDIGVGLGFNNLTGETGVFRDVDGVAATYLTIPVELTYRKERFYYGNSLILAFRIGHSGLGEYGWEVYDTDYSYLNPVRLAYSTNIGASIGRFDIGAYFTWWMTNMWQSEPAFGGSVYTPSIELGLHVAYRIKLK